MRKDQLNFSRVALVYSALALLFSGCGSANDATLRYEIIAAHPHDVAAFTQGLAIHEGNLVESTGRFGESTVSIKEITSGKTIRTQALDARQFGEGLTLVDDRIVQLTWTSGLALVYDLKLARIGEFTYAGQGWGLAFDGERLLMSDGSDRIVFRRPDTFAATGEIRVRADGRPLRKLNELEYAGGWLYANVWQTDRIAVIDPADGAVRAWLDLAPLHQHFDKPRGWIEGEHVLNGIAFNAANGHFYVTGKCWPVLFEIKVEALPPPAAK